MPQYTIEEAVILAHRAILSAGASQATAEALADAVVAAEISGHRAVGFTHLIDYLDGFKTGRIARNARPDITYPTPVAISVDAKDGVAQLGFDLAFKEVVQKAREYGISLFLQANSYTVGELSYYTRRLAVEGLLAIATSNSPATVTTDEVRQPLFGTNPMSFAAPVASGSPLVIDQASSATAFVNIRDAAARGAPIPSGWALDADGKPTASPADALKGLLLPFGGSRGANIALMVEVLSAGLAGGKWSIDVPSFNAGSQPLRVGLFITAIDPATVAPDFQIRLADNLEQLAAKGLYLPGRKPRPGHVDIDEDLSSRILLVDDIASICAP